MTAPVKHQLPEGEQDALISAMVLLILDQLDQTANTPDPHYQYLRGIFQRYPLQVVIAEIRNILASLYFPQVADLSHLVMKYHDITLVPQQKVGGYCTTFIYNETLHSTSVTTTPLKSLELAQHMVDQLRAGMQLPPSIEERAEQNGSYPEKAPVASTSPTVPPVSTSSSTPATQTPPAFIRIGRVAFAIDKILYVRDDSTANYQSVRVGLAGGVDMRFDANSSNNSIHTQEVRFIGEEARAFLDWHRRWTLNLSPISEIPAT